MTLEQNIERLYFTSGDGYEEEALPREIFSGPFAPDLEPEQIPFLVSPTNLRGYHDLATANGEPKRKLLLGLNDPKTSKRFSILGPNAQPIPVYDSPESALFELQPRVLPYQRENTTKLLEALAKETCVLRFTSGEYNGALSITNGKASSATLRSTRETLYGEPALAAFLLLFSYQPLRIEQRELTAYEPTTSPAAVQPLSAATLPAYAHTLREKLERQGMDRHVFNIEPDNGSYRRSGKMDYAVAICFSNVPVGLLRFQNGTYYDGEVRGLHQKHVGDDALLRALNLQPNQELSFHRLQDPKIFTPVTIGAPATNSALATTAKYLVSQ